MTRSRTFAPVLTGLALSFAVGCATDPGTNGDDEALFQEALALYNQMQYAPAGTLFDELVAAYPDSPRHDNAGYLTGRCSYELLDWNATIAKLGAMRAAHPDSLFVHNAAYFTGRARFRLADYLGAATEFRATIAADAQGTYADNAAYYVGRSAYEAGDFGAARIDLARFETDHGASSYLDNARYYLGRAFLDDADPAGALGPFARVFETTGTIFADNAQYYTGRAHYALGQLPQALLDLQTVDRSYPTSVLVDDALGWEARIYADLANCVDARATLSSLASRFPASTQITPVETYLAGKGC